MTEADRRPSRRRAIINVDIEDGEIVVKGKWHDGDGNRTDLGFAKLPSWLQAESMIRSMAARLVSVAASTDGWSPKHIGRIKK